MNTIENTIRSLKMQAEMLERQRLQDKYTAMGFRNSSDSSELKEGEAVVTVDRQNRYGFWPYVSIRAWSFCNIDFWIRPESLKPSDFNMIRRKMKYPDLEHLEKWIKKNNNQKTT